MTTVHLPQAGETVPCETMRSVAANILRLAGMSAANAQIMARGLTYAQEAGINSHGLAHLAAYIAGFESGALNANPQFQVITTLPATAILEADQAPGVLAGQVACDDAVRRAAAVGIGAVSVRNSSHFGAASAFVDRMVSQGMVGLVLSNASPTVAPRGAKTALFGTNPIACGFPNADGAPIILDLATTAGSRARIRKAAAEGEQIPEHWALDLDGLPTTNPKAALKGTMQALGGEKGTVLSLMVELICVALSGGKPGRHALPPQEPSDAPRNISHFFLALNPDGYGASGSVAKRVADIAQSITSAPPTTRGIAPRLPGQRAADHRAKAQTQGIVVSELLSKVLHDAHLAARILKTKSLTHEDHTG